MKRPSIVSVDEPTRGLKIRGQRVNNSSIPDHFWSSSTYEMENSAAQSQQSVSSTSMSNQTLEPHSNNSSNPSEFVNHGLLLWNQTRQQWIGNKGSERRELPIEPTIAWNSTYESLLGSNKPFPKPVPLGEMVEFLIDIWESEGLYG